MSNTEHPARLAAAMHVNTALSISPPTDRIARPTYTSRLHGSNEDWQIDVLQCPCGGRRSVIAVVTDSALANTLLTALGVPSDAVTFAPARSPPQAELSWDEAS